MYYGWSKHHFLVILNYDEWNEKCFIYFFKKVEISAALFSTTLIKSVHYVHYVHYVDDLVSAPDQDGLNAQYQFHYVVLCMICEVSSGILTSSDLGRTRSLSEYLK